MDLSKLENGLSFKNYEALCKGISMPIRQGESKIRLFQKLTRFCDFEKIKNSNKFVIKKVHYIPLIPEQSRYKDNFIFVFEILLMDILQKNQNQYLILDIVELETQLKMTNPKVIELSDRKCYKKNNFSSIGISETAYRTFIKNMRCYMMTHIRQGLNYLQRNEWIDYVETYSCIKNGEKYILTPDEYNFVLDKKKKLLQSYGVSSTYFLGKNTRSYHIQMDDFLKQQGWEFCSIIFYIKNTHKYLNMKLSDFRRNALYVNMNQIIINGLLLLIKQNFESNINYSKKNMPKVVIGKEPELSYDERMILESQIKLIDLFIKV